jgi:perosamine synthetase
MRKITLGTLNISQRGKEYVNDCLDFNRLSRGRYTEMFEDKFSLRHGCKHGIFMNSGTSALQVALAALKERYGYAYGDEVLVPATTFIATSNVVIQNGLTPVFVDVDRDTFNIDVCEIGNKITSKTRCIIPVHLFGLPADMPTIMTVARRVGLQVIEDSCETVGATVFEKSVGSFGDMACFSMYVAHHVVGGIGGLVTTNDSKLDELCRSLMAHGRDSIYTNIDDDDNTSGDKLQSIVERRYSFERVGYSYRATELEAAIALSELERIDQNIAIRQQNAMHLTELLKSLWRELQLPYIAHSKKESTHSFMMYPMVCKTGVNRDKLLMFLEEHGIETRYLFPLLEQPIYRKLFPGQERNFPIAKNLAQQGFFIGIHQGLTSEDIRYVAETIHAYFLGYK